MTAVRLIQSAAENGVADADCTAVIRRHSRSFTIASRLLPKRIRVDVHSLYAWCRTVDDAVDEATSDQSAQRILETLECDLERMQRGESPVHPASLWIEPLVVGRRIDIRYAKELIAGMRMDLADFSVRDHHDLNRYCYHAAGTVGLMMTQLMGARDPLANRHAIALGVAMQLTNIARDVLEDAKRGRSYLPKISKPLEAGPSDVRFAVKDILAIAEQNYLVASKGLHYLPLDCRFAIRVALALYREIGREIARRDFDVVRGRTSISKLRLIWVLCVASLESISDRFLSSFKFMFRSKKFYTGENAMNDLKTASVSSVAEAKHAVYLGLSLTAIMSCALFMMVFVNPKDASYSYLPLVYGGVSLICAVVFNRLATRCLPVE